MVKKHVRKEDLLGKVIDAHTHVGISLKAFAQLEFPYCSSIEDIYYRQRANGVQHSVVFPINGDLFFDLGTYIATGKLTPAAKPLSPVPYERENRMLLTELFSYCPELKGHFIPFVSVDPGRMVKEQVQSLRALADEFPIYGIKISPVACQSPVAQLLGVGAPFLELAAELNWPLLLHVTVHPDETFSQAADALRVAEHHPEIRFCLAHCIGLHQRFLERADELANVWVDTAALKAQVQLAFDGSTIMALPGERIPCDCSNHIAVMQTLVERFPRTMIWGSDAPYHSYISRRMQAQGAYVEFRLKGTYEDEKAALDALPAAAQAQLGANVLRFIFG
jgi:predicted TIM-barrel fold metal-dependent hydrolase